MCSTLDPKKHIHNFLDIPAMANSLKTELGTTPMTLLGVVFDSIISTKTDPLWKRTILSLLLGKSALCAERLLGWLFEKRTKKW